MSPSLLDLILEVAKASTGIVLIVGAWIGVQLAWKRVFPGVAPDEDVLASRIECGSCDHHETCELPAAAAHPQTTT